MPADHSIAILVPSPARPASSGFLQFVLVLLMELKVHGASLFTILRLALPPIGLDDSCRRRLVSRTILVKSRCSAT